MRVDESELKMVERHVREGKAILAQQPALVSRLAGLGLPFDYALSFLHLYEDSQRLHVEHLQRLSGRELWKK